jgi:hypothetical protein
MFTKSEALSSKKSIEEFLRRDFVFEHGPSPTSTWSPKPAEWRRRRTTSTEPAVRISAKFVVSLLLFGIREHLECPRDH